MTKLNGLTRWFRSVNWTYVTVALIVRMFMLGAAAISFSHIIDVSRTLGLGWEAYTVPFLVDGLAVLGMIGRSPKFAESTQHAGLKMMAGAGVISLVCNVMAGDNLGQRLYGILVVAGFVTTEWYATKLRPAPVVVEQPTRKLDPQTAAERAAKAAATRKRNADAKLTPAQKAAKTRAANRAIDAELAAMTGERVPANAPVSPAV